MLIYILKSPKLPKELSSRTGYKNISDCKMKRKQPIKKLVYTFGAVLYPAFFA